MVADPSLKGGIPSLPAKTYIPAVMTMPTTVAITPFRVGAGAVGEPLRAWSNEVIECQFNRLKPAHTRVLFAYAA